MKSFPLYFLLLILINFSSCEPNEVEFQDPEVATSIQDIEGVSIPNGFNFVTERNVTLNITDETPFVKYEVYGYSSQNGSGLDNISDALNNLLYSGKPYNGIINQVLTLSNMYDKVYISRKDGLEYSFEIKDISNNIINFISPLATRSANNSTSTNNGSRTLCPECNGDIFKNASFEDGPDLPTTYIQTDENNVDGWSTTSPDSLIELWKSEFNGVTSQSGDYHAEINATQNAALYQRICTTPNAEISWSVWHRGREGVDVATVRIGDDLSTATVETTMTTDNTAWVNYTGTYTVPAGQEDTFIIFEAVSSTYGRSYGNFIDNVVITETNAGDTCSGDSIILYPSGLNKANIAFEDLWPVQGDYDFNDLVISYNIIAYLNAQNNVTQLDYNYTVESAGAAYTNGYGIELEGVLPSAISSVTGTNLTEGFIVNDANGTEQGQRNAVIVFFDNADIHVGIPNTISIILSSPITTAVLGPAPFNPFLIRNRNRNIEIHLPNKPVTSYPTLPIGAADDIDGNFKNPNGFPWAINISGEYTPPLPGIKIWDGYNFFINWATSGGVSYPLWFTDLPGHRNNNNLNN
jgi:LruC domain-containing protein